MNADPRVLNSMGNEGVGSINGAGSMSAAALGLRPLMSTWNSGAEHSEKTLQKLYDTPLRKAEFER
jgi:hypothetical protein